MMKMSEQQIETEISQEDFLDYESVRISGLTNMFMVSQVVALSDNLDKEKCITIMKNYSKLKKTYGVK